MEAVRTFVKKEFQDLDFFSAGRLRRIQQLVIFAQFRFGKSRTAYKQCNSNNQTLNDIFHAFAP